MIEGFHPKSKDLSGWFDYDDLYRSIVEKAPENSTIVELGVYAGKSLAYLAEYAEHLGKKLRIVGVDLFCHYEPIPEGESRKEGINSFESVSANLAKCCAIPPELVRSDSSMAAAMFDDGSVFALFIDADHSRKGVRRDILAWHNKIQIGGLIAGHDIDDPNVENGILDTGYKFNRISSRSWILREFRYFRNIAQIGTEDSETLHIVTACARPDHLAAIIESLKPYGWVHWHVMFDIEKTAVGGQALKNRMISEIRDGWVWVLDDDNLPSPGLLNKVRSLINSGDPTDGYIFSQTRHGKLIPAMPPKVGETDAAQAIIRRQAIDTFIPHDYSGDGAWLCEIWKSKRLSLAPDVVVSYNAQKEIQTLTIEAMKTEPAAFYHVAGIGHWKEIVTEQLSLLKRANFTGRIYIGFIGQQFEDGFISRVAGALGLNFEIRHFGGDMHQFEFPTLAWCHEYCQTSPERPILYFHGKAVTNTRWQWLMWRWIMNAYNLTHWRSMVAALTDKNCAGVSWHNGFPVGYFPGNFWWARSSFIREFTEIPEYIRQFEECLRSQNPNRFTTRHAAECWINSRMAANPFIAGPPESRFWDHAWWTAEENEPWCEMAYRHGH